MFPKKKDISFLRKNKLTSSAKIINPNKLLYNKGTKLRFARTSSALNLPGIRFDPNDSNISHNTTAFTFKSKKSSKGNKNSISQLLNINSIEDFIGREKDPLEKQKQLYEEMKEEKMKIRKILSNLISWDNEPAAEEIESLKIIKKKNKINIKDINKDKVNKNSKTSKTMDNIYSSNAEDILTKSNEEIKLKEHQNKIMFEGLPMMKGKAAMNLLNEMNVSKGTKIKEKKMKLTQLKFSVFDKDYDPKKYDQMEQEDQLKKEREKLTKFHEKSNLAQLQKEQRRMENAHREEIAIIYKNIIINKIKKQKFTEVLDETYKLLDRARIEYSLSVDILKERIKAVQKYYNAYIIAIDKLSDNKKNNPHGKNTSNSGKDSESETSKRSKVKKTGFNIYEEKIKRYREYLLIMEDLNKEIKNYDDKFALIQEDLNTLLNTSSERIEQLTLASRKLKYIFRELNNQQTQYYLSLLKNGNDTRTEGLSWIVRRLMELNVQIDGTMFPGFLDQEQIDFIIQISKLYFEGEQLKKILESLRESQTVFKFNDRYFMGYESKETQKYQEKINRLQLFNSDINNIEQLLKKDENCKSFKSINKLRNPNNHSGLNNKSDFKNQVLQNYMENIVINSIIKDIKRKLAMNFNGEFTFQKEKSKNRNIIKFLLAKDENKDYYQDVIILSERIQKLNIFIKKMRKEEFLIFEEKFKYGIKDERSKKFYDKVFNALFGSSSLEFTDFQKVNLAEQ